jgi:hypothetical protein
MVIQGPSWSSPLRAWRSPLGKKWIANSASLRAVYGVKGYGLTIILLPVISADTIFPIARSTGKFHGTIAADTPIGVNR